MKSISNSYFSNEYLTPHFEKFNQDFDFIKEYFLTNVYLPDKQTQNTIQPKLEEHAAKFYTFCLKFQQDLFILMNTGTRHRT